MPCESCNVQFTVFKRRRLCTECRRYYCNQCLVKRKEKTLCERCVVLTARPLSKVDLLKLKPKDLIFYLQSKHISTTGCVEKEELVNLILSHVNGTAETNQRPGNNQPHLTEDSENCSNPFDQIKQTCQSLFNSFTERIVIDLNLETKPPSDINASRNVYNQPRQATRKMPTYSNAASYDTTTSNITSQQPRQNPVPRSSSANSNNKTISSSTSDPSSPISSMSSQSYSSQNPITTTIPRTTIPNNLPSVHNHRRLHEHIAPEAAGSGCECSDDEIIAKFQSRHRLPTQQEQQSSQKLSPQSQTDSAFEDQIPGPSGSGGMSASPSKSSSGNQKSSEDSSGSSFEELGAVGGASNCGASDQEHWQIVNKVEIPSCHESSNMQSQPTESNASSSNATFQLHSSISNLNEGECSDSPINIQKTRKILRRRSDGYIPHFPNRRHSDTAPHDEESDDTSQEKLCRKRLRKCCSKCGKTKLNLKKQLMKFRRQLENSTMTENEIKQEIEDFLSYLESRSRESFECSDPEIKVDLDARRQERDEVMESTASVLDDDGIHVYGHREEDGGGFWRHDGRFINLGDFKSSSEFDDLSVKQLKEILMLNRVDFKGCCEKQELLDRVHRLWTDLQTSPAVDKLPTNDLCKICMDAPIECVILECGHMATCTNCGKVLSECPICRQYIVRVVRFFRA